MSPVAGLRALHPDLFHASLALLRRDNGIEILSEH